MAISKGQRRMVLRRKLCLLRHLTSSKSVTKNSVIMDAFHYIYKLKLQLKAIQQEYHHRMQHIQEVKVEKVEENLVEVKVACRKGKDVLVSILEVFERMELNVVHTRVSCNYIFGMQAIVEAHDKAPDVRQLKEAVLKAIQTQTDDDQLGTVCKSLHFPMFNNN